MVDAIDADRAVALADIDDAHLAPFQQRMAGRTFRFALAWQVKRSGARHRAADNKSFAMRVGEADFARAEQAGYQMPVAQILVAGAVHHRGMGGVIGFFEHAARPPARQRCTSSAATAVAAIRKAPTP